MAVAEGLRRRPFLVVAAPVAAGIALSEALPAGALLWPSLATLPLLGYLAARRPRFRLLCWALIGLAAGAGREEWSRHRPPTDVRHLDRDVEVRLVGRVLDAPHFYSSGSGSFLLDIESVTLQGHPQVW